MISPSSEFGRMDQIVWHKELKEPVKIVFCHSYSYYWEVRTLTNGSWKLAAPLELRELTELERAIYT